MCDSGISFPVPIDEADLSRSFVYDRRYGVFYVTFGRHHFAMALLLVWDLGVYNYLHIDYEKLGISEFRSDDIYEYSDYFLSKTKGTCYKSSQAKSIKAGQRGNLNERESDYFVMVDYLDQ